MTHMEIMGNYEKSEENIIVFRIIFMIVENAFLISMWVPLS